MTRPRALLYLALTVVFVAGCASANPMAHTPVPGAGIAGFWAGLRDGLLAPFAFVVSLFDKTINVYEVHNNGEWYNLGFLLAISGTAGSSSRRAGRRRRYSADA